MHNIQFNWNWIQFKIFIHNNSYLEAFVVIFKSETQIFVSQPLLNSTELLANIELLLSTATQFLQKSGWIFRIFVNFERNNKNIFEFLTLNKLLIFQII